MNNLNFGTIEYTARWRGVRDANCRIRDNQRIGITAASTLGIDAMTGVVPVRLMVEVAGKALEDYNALFL